MPSKKTPQQKLKVSIRTSKEIFSWETYTISVDVTNISDSVVDNVAVKPQSVPGLLLQTSEGPENTVLEQLESQKRKIVRELETQVSTAYENKTYRELSRLGKINASLARLFTLRSSVSFNEFSVSVGDGTSPLSIPAWAKQALQIEDWADLERMEKDIMVYEDAESFLRKAFEINKSKLRKILDKLDEAKSSPDKANDDLKDVYSIHPSDTITFIFKARAPFVIRTRDYSAQFLISYNEPSSGTVGTFSENQAINFFPSPLIIYVGVFLGAIGGFIVRVFLNPQIGWLTPAFGVQLAVNLILAFVVAYVTVRTPNSNKSIIADSFAGGFVIGVLTAIFSDSITEKLKVLASNI